MIKNIIRMLTLDEHYKQSENIEIAKGKYELQSTIKGGVKQIKRQWQKIKK